ncbi:MAG: PAS domain S-box protein [Planctomycetota bacterium]
MAHSDLSGHELQSKLRVLREEHLLLQQHNATLLRLALSQQQPDLNFDQTIRQFTSEVADFLRAQRVSVWIYNRDKTCMRCLDCFDATESSHDSGQELEVEKFPQFVAALEEERNIAAADAANDSRTAEFVTWTRTPFNIFSMLASPIRVQRALRGVMYCEHVGTGREWTEQQQHFLSSVTDLLALSIATHDMRRTEQTMLALLESAAQGVIAVSDDGNITVVNSLVEKMFGYQREELIGRPIELLLPKELSDNTIEIQDGTLSRSSSHQLSDGKHFTGHRKSGEKFPVEIALSFVKQDGEHLALALVTDVTKRVEADRKLKQSEELYRNVVEDQTDLISRCTPDGMHTFVNRAYCQYYGKTPDQLMGASIFDAVPPRDRKKIRSSFESLASGTPVNSYEHRVLQADGTLSLNQRLDRAIYAESGTLKEIQSISRDVTKEREAESQLREAQRLESIAVLASGIAHDFNNLLTPILIYAEGLRSYFADGSIESSQVLQIQAAASRAKELVRQILTFGRDSHELKRIPSEVAPVIQDTLQLLRASAPKEIQFEVAVDTDCGTVEADPSELYQILSNLCTNACQAMPTGGTLCVSASEVSLEISELPPGRYVQLIVQDTGSGIAVDDLAKIFDPFFSTKAAGEGTGLGLSVVHGAVTGLGGRIDVQSQLGKGTTFVVVLPCTSDPSPSTPSPAALADASLGNERILLVDDEKAVLQATQFMLQKLGYHVTACASANEALACFASDPQKYDLVLSDMTMPRTSGVDLLRRIRQQSSNVPLILMTGFAGLLNETELGRYGIDQCIIKPLNSQELAAKIQRGLDRDSSRRLATPVSKQQRSNRRETVLVVDDDPMVRKAMVQLLGALGFKSLTASTIDEARGQVIEHSLTAVLVDHNLKGEDGFAAVKQLRRDSAREEGKKSPKFIGMTGVGLDDIHREHALDAYLVKPFDGDQLRSALRSD